MTPSLHRQLRLLIGLGIALCLVVLFIALVVLSESSLSLWQMLQEAPAGLFYAYAGGFALFAIFSVLVLWRVLSPRKEKLAAEGTAPLSETVLQERVRQASEVGVNVSDAQRELAKLGQRRASGEIYVAVFGEISSGKSALIKALANVADIAIGVTGGTTRNIEHYAWQSPAGDRLVLTDVPGLNEVDGKLNLLAQEEAIRAHVVIYVCDGDLTQTQFRELKALLALGKPVILALNKTDRYSDTELAQIKQRLSERLAGEARAVVTMKAGGRQEVIRQLPDGREEVVERVMAPDIAALVDALQRILDSEPGVLESLRDANVFKLVAHKLEVSTLAHQRGLAEEVVKQYTRKAVVGALAAVSPGTDLLIQGYLATSMLKELCDVFKVPVSKLDIERFLDLSQSHLGKTTPLLLAVAGNALKAFPGVGTLVGGLVHAVAYGLIFDTLGRAVIQSLEGRGSLLPVAAADLFKEKLGDNLESRTQRLVQLALQAAQRK